MRLSKTYQSDTRTRAEQEGYQSLSLTKLPVTVPRDNLKLEHETALEYPRFRATKLVRCMYAFSQSLATIQG